LQKRELFCHTMIDKDYYKILQIDSSAEQEVVQAAYKRLALKYHPDKNSSADAVRRMQELNEAYEIVGDPIRRKEYDRLYFQQSSASNYQTQWNTQQEEIKRRAENERQQREQTDAQHRASEYRQKQEQERQQRQRRTLQELETEIARLSIELRKTNAYIEGVWSKQHARKSNLQRGVLITAIGASGLLLEMIAVIPIEWISYLSLMTLGLGIVQLIAAWMMPRPTPITPGVFEVKRRLEIQLAQKKSELMRHQR
jgi:hypothetical protein